MKTKNQFILFKSAQKLISKVIFFICLTLLLPFQMKGQLAQYLQNLDGSQTLYDIKTGMDIYMDSLKAVQDSATFYAEGGEYIEYQKFLNYWEMRLFPDGDFTKAYDADSIFYANASNYQYFSDEPWHEVGPVDQTFGIGPVEYLSIFDDGTVDSTRYMLVASLLGGVFYSTDYGESWNSTGTDTQLAKSGSGCAIFHPTNHAIWYASSSNNSNEGYSTKIGKTGGVYRTTNEGDSWEQIADHLDFDSWASIYKLLILPDYPDVLFAVTSKGIYKTTNCSVSNPTWTKVLDGLAYDIELKPGSNSTLYATVFVNGAWKVMISTNYGDYGTWNALTEQPQIVVSNDIRGSSFTIEVSKAKPDYLYCQVDNNYYANLYYIDFGGAGIWNQFNTSKFYVTMGMGQGFGVDQVNNGEDVMVSYYKYMKKFNINTTGSGSTKYPHHVDVEDIIYHPYNSGEVWACTHGGVEKFTNGGTTWIAKYNGLAVANVERMATSVTDPEYIMVGLYHDGTQITRTDYDFDWSPEWEHVYVGDGMRPLIDPYEPNKMWASWQNGHWAYSTDHFNTFDENGYLHLRSGFYTDGVLNKVLPSIMYRKGYIGQSGEDFEVFKTENSQNIAVSSFQQQFPGCLIWQLFTPYTNENYLLISMRDNATQQWHLYRTTNINDQPQSVQWSDLPIPRNGWIASVDFDPDNEDIVYLVYTNSSNEDNSPYGNQMVYKIDYTNPSIPVFTYLTKNLPITSTGSDCVEIDNGSTRGIYLYTEYGIFYTNNDMINSGFDCWQLLGENLPHTRAGSLEINYVCKKLRAGLYGRGVWELPLPCITDQGDVTVSTNETWTNDTRISGIVIVQPQVELTILNSTISFGDNAKLIVKPGAKLILDGARLTSACGASAWLGIEVWGNTSAHQYPDANGNYQQGYVELKNGAIVENAWEAVQPWHPEHWDETGGIIVANGATFRNNRRAVQFMSYQNFDPQTGNPRPNQSYFSNCTFETTDDFEGLFGESPFHSFISMYKVEGVSITGCDFIDYRDYFNFDVNNTNGIRTIDANFSVSPLGAKATHFEGLITGIYSSQLETNNTYRVDETDFIDNQIGIYNTECDFASCIRSNFSLGTKEPSPYEEINVGLLNTYSTGFTYEQNTFGKSTGYSTDHELDYGIWNVITGENTNIIYKNYFSSFHYANVAIGLNRDYRDDYIGLMYKCNENSTNLWYDFLVQDGLGIAGNQGTQAEAAGNTFSQNSTPLYSDFANFGERPINYYLKFRSFKSTINTDA